MMIEANFIAGIMLGIEFITPEDDEYKYFVIDIFFVRLTCTFE
jgi:hypothetical protein